MKLSHILHPEISAIPNETLLAYFFLIADSLNSKHEDIRTYMTIVQLCEFTNYPVATVDRCLSELQNMGWIKRHKDYIQTGYFDSEGPKWLVKEEKKEEKKMTPSISYLEDREEEIRPIYRTLTNELKNRINPSKTKPKEVVGAFKSRYREKFNLECPLVNDDYSTTCGYISRAGKWTGGHDETISLIEFLFENWETISKKMKIDGPPTFHMLGSSKFMPRFLDFKIRGIKKDGFTDRYVPTDKETGW